MVLNQDLTGVFRARAFLWAVLQHPFLKLSFHLVDQVHFQSRPISKSKASTKARRHQVCTEFTVWISGLVCWLYIDLILFKSCGVRYGMLSAVVGSCKDNTDNVNYQQVSVSGISHKCQTGWSTKFTFAIPSINPVVKKEKNVVMCSFQIKPYP